MALAAKSTSMMKALTMWSGKSAMFAPLRCFCTGASDLVTGTCKWFDVQKGFGFITVDNEERDVFVHQRNIRADGFRSLAEGEPVEFEIREDSHSGKMAAFNVTGPEGAAVQGAPRRDPPRDRYGSRYDDSYRNDY